MKKLYAILIILIIIYVGVNVSINGFSVFPANNTTTATNDVIEFPSLDKNFSLTKINDTATKYVDKANNITIQAQTISDKENVSEIHDKLMNGGSYTSSQKINQQGVTTYFLYKEGPSTYDADIFFNKNGTNYKISGEKITYGNSDYFINHCKQIINKI